VLDAGQIVEQGTPRTLLQQHGLYAALSRTQRVGIEQLPVE
jgi:ABC-type multidrug transport system fused ATPase/permease subunit